MLGRQEKQRSHMNRVSKKQKIAKGLIFGDRQNRIDGSSSTGVTDDLTSVNFRRDVLSGNDPNNDDDDEIEIVEKMMGSLVLKQMISMISLMAVKIMKLRVKCM